MGLETIADLERLLSAEQVIEKFLDVRAVYPAWISALCPFHEDTKPSLSVNISTGRYFCRGCAKVGPFTDIVLKTGSSRQKEQVQEMIGKKKIRLAPIKSWIYRDEEGKPLFAAIKYFPKDFSQFRIEGEQLISGMDGVQRPLFRIERIAQAAPGSTIWLVEGEKDVESLEGAGCLATTNVGGSSAWRHEYAQALLKLSVRVVPDNDEPGRKWLRRVASDLPEARIYPLPKDFKDITEFLQAGQKLETLKPQTIGEFFAEEREKLVETGLDLLRKKSSFPALLRTGFEPVDRVLGVRQGGAILFSGYTGMGKTCMVASVVAGLIKAGKKVLVLPFEEKTDVFQRRLLLQSGIIDTLEAEISQEMLVDVEGYGNLIFPKNFEDFPNDMDRIAPMIEDIISLESIDVVVLDHIQELYIKGSTSGHFSMSNIGNRINEIRRKRGATWLIVSQMRKPLGGKDGDLPEPNLYDLKESGKLPEMATAVFIVHTRRGESIIKCAKNRYGPMTRIPVEFDKQRLFFRTIEGEIESENITLE